MQKQVPFDEAQQFKYPQPLMVAVAKDREGKINPITVAWSMMVSHEPPMMAVAIGKTRLLCPDHSHLRMFLPLPTPLSK